MGTPAAVVSRRRRPPAVAWWALAGAAVVVFEVVVLGRWVTGPYFTRVHTGPTRAPAWMTDVFDVWQVAGLFGAGFCFYWFLIRPWRREHRITTDGLLVIACSTLWFMDPMSAYFGHWFTYNTNLVNFGSWINDVPGWHSFGKPGAMIAEPIVLIGPVYVYFIMIGTLFGCAVMRAAKRRWPALKALHLVALCFLAMAVLDVVAEGLVWLPLGFWEYPGGIGLLFSHSYHTYPVNEMLTIAAMFTGICSLRYFKDDRGLTLAERGVDALRMGARSKTLVRGLAIIAATQLIMLVGYNLPNAWIGSHSRAWPAQLQERSYLTDNLCGPGTRNLCPGNGHGFVVDRSATSG
jgi:Spirocyclase AveC-like